MSENTSNNSQPQSKMIDRIALGLLALAVFAAILRFVPSVRLSLLYAAGRSPVCPYELAIDSENMLRDHIEKKRELMKQSRLVEQDELGYSLWETPRGTFWAPSSDKDDTLASILIEMQNQIYGGKQHGPRAGDIVVDCGAHVGVFSKAAIAAGAKHVIAVEPSPVNLVALERNLAEEIEQGLITVVRKGVWHEESTLPFYIDPGNSAGSAVLLGRGHDHGDGHMDEGEGDAQEHTVEVPLTTIDNLVAELGLERVDFIKFDIEGSERHALKGARKTLADFKPRIGSAAYHLTDDQTKIPEAVMAANPSYELECGPCGEREGWVIPHTLNFY